MEKKTSQSSVFSGFLSLKSASWNVVISRNTGGCSSPSEAVLAGDCEVTAVGVAVSKGRLPPLVVTWTTWTALTPLVLSLCYSSSSPGSVQTVEILLLSRYWRDSVSYVCGLVFPHTVKPVAADTANISTNKNRFCYGR